MNVVKNKMQIIKENLTLSELKRFVGLQLYQKSWLEPCRIEEIYIDAYAKRVCKRQICLGFSHFDGDKDLLNIELFNKNENYYFIENEQYKILLRDGLISEIN